MRILKKLNKEYVLVPINDVQMTVSCISLYKIHCETYCSQPKKIELHVINLILLKPFHTYFDCVYFIGPLDPVVDLSCSFINSSAINISWIPPFTLPNTTINGYNFSVTTYEEEIAKNFTPYTYYLFILSNMTNFFNATLTVAAYNGLNGIIAEISGFIFKNLNQYAKENIFHHVFHPIYL